MMFGKALLLAMCATYVFAGLETTYDQDDDCCLGGAVVNADGNSIKCSSDVQCPDTTTCTKSGECCLSNPCTLSCTPPLECKLQTVNCPVAPCPPVQACL